MVDYNFIDSQLTSEIIKEAIDIHRKLGPGLLESTYRLCLTHSLKRRGFGVSTEKPLALNFEGLHIPEAYRMDVVVENRIVVELKAVEQLSDKHLAQVLTYLKWGNYRIGLLVNFNETTLREGVRRVINKYYIGP